MADDIDISFERLSASERHRLLRTLRAGETELAELRRVTGVSAKTLAATLDDLHERGLLEARTTELETIDTDYQCSQELTGREPAPVERRYVLTATGQSVCDALDTTVCTPI
jgi:DNA-binding HxlR family transcriptional regulator